MSRWVANSTLVAFVVFCALAIPLGAQTAPPSTPLLSPEQLDTLVAPVALYPDPLLAQVLAASTYPLELVEAQQWIEQRRDLRGPQLIEAAKQQNWDPSVQAMVAFPDALALLTRDVRWTTDLGNAFLAQQTDLMSAVQRLRARAQFAGALRTTPQQTVTAQSDYGPSPIAIQPADPQVMYVPTYNPAYVWGAPAGGSYPELDYGNSGSGFGVANFLGTLFSGLASFGGWGWGLDWLNPGLLLNNLFFNHFGFGGGGFGNGFGGGFVNGGSGDFGGTTIWAHNPVHRLGVAYPAQVAGRFNSIRGSWRSFNNNRGSFNASFNAGFNGGRSFSPPAQQSWRGFDGGSRTTQFVHSPPPQSDRQVARSFQGGGYERAMPSQGYRGYSNPPFQSSRNFLSGSSRAFANPAPQRSERDFRNSGSSSTFRAPSHFFSGPRSSPQHSAPQHFSAPRSSSHFSAPRIGRSAGSHGSSRSGGHGSHSKHH